MHIRSAAIFLTIASCFWIVMEVYWIIVRFTGTSWSYYRNNIIDGILPSLMIVVPLALLFFCLAVLRNLRNSGPQDKNLGTIDEEAREEVTTNPSIGDWLLYYLVVIIPLVGFIFFIVWATDDNNRVRKNWAMASLIWTAIILVLGATLMATVFRGEKMVLRL